MVQAFRRFEKRLSRKCEKIRWNDYSEIRRNQYGKRLGSSDQGCHYTSVQFRQLLKDIGLRQSMSCRANCWDNAPQESFFGHMKDEIDISEGSSFYEIYAIISDWADYYNNDRCQWDLAKLSPREYYSYLTTGDYPLHIRAPKGQSHSDQECKNLNCPWQRVHFRMGFGRNPGGIGGKLGLFQCFHVFREKHTIPGPPPAGILRMIGRIFLLLVVWGERKLIEFESRWTCPHRQIHLLFLLLHIVYIFFSNMRV